MKKCINCSVRKPHIRLFLKCLTLQHAPMVQRSPWGRRQKIQGVKHCETNRRGMGTICYQTTWVKCCLGAKLCWFPQRDGDKAGCHISPRGTRHQCKHPRDKIIQPAFRDFGRSPIFLVPYLELVPSCWASQLEESCVYVTRWGVSVI